MQQLLVAYLACIIDIAIIGYLTGLYNVICYSSSCMNCGFLLFDIAMWLSHVMCRQLIEIIDFSMVVWQLNCRGYCKIINLTKDKRDYSYLKKSS